MFRRPSFDVLTEIVAECVATPPVAPAISRVAELACEWSICFHGAANAHEFAADNDPGRSLILAWLANVVYRYCASVFFL